jgi:predicted nucleic acid-binding protein
MRAVDTNVLVRLLSRDDPPQVEAAEAFIAGGAWVSHLVLAETMSVLAAVYEPAASDIALAVEMLLQHHQLTIQDPDVVEAALGHLRKKPPLGFSDCLVLEIARKAGHLPLGSFDRGFAKLEGVEGLCG